MQFITKNTNFLGHFKVKQRWREKKCITTLLVAGPQRLAMKTRVNSWPVNNVLSIVTYEHKQQF